MSILMDSQGVAVMRVCTVGDTNLLCLARLYDMIIEHLCFFDDNRFKDKEDSDKTAPFLFLGRHPRVKKKKTSRTFNA